MSREKLWLYHLHYQQYLLQEDCDAAYWVRKWIQDNPPYQGNGWEPYPISLRLFSWIKVAIQKKIVLDEDVLSTFSRMVSRLYSRIEFHLDGNHLLENLLALYLASYFFEHTDFRNRRIRERIESLLKKALDEQFLEDGGHYERTPMYQAILMERIADLLNIVDRNYCPELQDKLVIILRRGMRWLNTMAPFGRIALFNDSAYNGTPDLNGLNPYVARILNESVDSLVQPLDSMIPSGYIRVGCGDWTIIQDVGPVGPDHQPGHSHCDMLSFCAWLNGQEIIVDSGNCTYRKGEMRQYCRSTRAHNTVTLNDMEQAEIWASHRVGRRGYPVVPQIECSSQRISMKSGHMAYHFLPGKPTVVRNIILDNNRLMVEDRVESNHEIVCASYLHFSPNVSIQKIGKDIIVIADSRRIRISSSVEGILEKGYYCPDFGKIIENTVVRFVFKNKLEYVLTPI